MGTATVKAPRGLVTVAARSGTVAWLKAKIKRTPGMVVAPHLEKSKMKKEVKPMRNQQVTQFSLSKLNVHAGG